MQRSADSLNGDVAGGAFDVAEGTQHLSVAGRLKVAEVELFQQEAAEGAALGLVFRLRCELYLERTFGKHVSFGWARGFRRTARIRRRGTAQCLRPSGSRCRCAERSARVLRYERAQGWARKGEIRQNACGRAQLPLCLARQIRC